MGQAQPTRGNFRPFGMKGGHRGRFHHSRGRGKGRHAPEEEKAREPQPEAGTGNAQQDPNIAAGSVNIMDIQFGLVPITHHELHVPERSVNMIDIQFGSVETIAGGFAGGGAFSSVGKRNFRALTR